MNNVKYKERLAFIRSVFLREFRTTLSRIEPIQYDPNCEFPYNNFIYKLDVSAPDQFHDQLGDAQLRPGTVLPPKDCSTFVMRLSNAAAGLNDVNRVQNEVATMSLFRDALEQASLHLVPKVYGWASAAQGQGWILQEYMAGENRPFKSMSPQEKKSVLAQMADVFGALQSFRLPETIKDYGGLTFDGEGSIISGPMTLITGGPFKTYEALYAEIIRSQLIIADDSTILEGWRPDGVRERLNCFLRQGLPQVMQKVDSGRKVLVHGDYTTDNLLFDPETSQITAILDFDWSFVGSTADEFLRSFGDIPGKLPSSFNKDLDTTALRVAMLGGFQDSSPAPNSGTSWETAKIWDDELEQRNIPRPRTIKGIDLLSDLFWLSQQICPFLLCNPTVLQYRTPSQRDRDRAETEKLLSAFLKAQGF